MLVARKWPKYVNHWENAERKLMELRVMQFQDSKVKQRIKKVFVFIMLLAVSEFGLVYADETTALLFFDFTLRIQNHKAVIFSL